MNAPYRVYSKTAVERRRFYLDYGCWLEEDEQLVDFQVQISPHTEGKPITVDGSYPDAAARQLMLFIAGGKENTTYTLQFVVRTDAGQVKRDDIGMRVYP